MKVVNTHAIRQFSMPAIRRPPNVPTGTFSTMFRLEHLTMCSDWNTQHNVPVGTLKRFHNLLLN